MRSVDRARRDCKVFSYYRGAGNSDAVRGFQAIVKLLGNMARYYFLLTKGNLTKYVGSPSLEDIKRRKHNYKASRYFKDWECTTILDGVA